MANAASDWAAPWPYPWSRLEQLALEADIEADELREFLEREVARRRDGNVIPGIRFGGARRAMSATRSTAQRRGRVRRMRR
jgi:hypothetical protein